MSPLPRAALAAVLVLSVAGAARRAAAASFRCPESHVEIDLAVVFGNGMFTDVAGAQASLDVLRHEVPHLLDSPREAIEFGLAYNNNEALLQQLRAVVRQRVAMSTSHFWRMLGDLEVMPEAVRDVFYEHAALEELSAFDSDLDLSRHVQTYEDHLRKGRSIVVVAHSQGNLYANAAHAALFPRPDSPGYDNFGVVSVATAAPYVAGRHPPACDRELGCYTTLKQDKVIATLRPALRDTLPGNVDDGSDTGDDLHHDFVATYWSLSSTRERILAHIKAHVDAFPNLTESISSGPITASLRWNTGHDLDLHVFERGGRAHVFYGEPEGIVGYLDHDDRTGEDPENYFALCEDLRPGVYEFDVGYYAGDGPVDAELLLWAGDTNRVFRRTLDAAMGQDAITNPIPLAWLFVDELGWKYYDFTIVGDEP